MTSKKELKENLRVLNNRVTDLMDRFDKDHEILRGRKNWEELGLTNRVQELAHTLGALSYKVHAAIPDPPEPKKRVTIRWPDPDNEMIITLGDREEVPQPGDSAWQYTDFDGERHLVNLSTAIEVVVTIEEPESDG